MSAANPPIRVLFTDADTFDQAVAMWEVVARESSFAEGYNPHAHRVVVGRGGKVLKDNTGFCTNGSGRFTTTSLCR